MFFTFETNFYLVLFFAMFFSLFAKSCCWWSIISLCSCFADVIHDVYALLKFLPIVLVLSNFVLFENTATVK